MSSFDEPDTYPKNNVEKQRTDDSASNSRMRIRDTTHNICAVSPLVSSPVLSTLVHPLKRKRVNNEPANISTATRTNSESTLFSGRRESTMLTLREKPARLKALHDKLQKQNSRAMGEKEAPQKSPNRLPVNDNVPSSNLSNAGNKSVPLSRQNAIVFPHQIMSKPQKRPTITLPRSLRRQILANLQNFESNSVNSTNSALNNQSLARALNTQLCPTSLSKSTPMLTSQPAISSDFKSSEKTPPVLRRDHNVKVGPVWDSMWNTLSCPLPSLYNEQPTDQINSNLLHSILSARLVLLKQIASLYQTIDDFRSRATATSFSTLDLSDETLFGGRTSSFQGSFHKTNSNNNDLPLPVKTPTGSRVFPVTPPRNAFTSLPEEEMESSGYLGDDIHIIDCILVFKQFLQEKIDHKDKDRSNNRGMKPVRISSASLDELYSLTINACVQYYDSNFWRLIEGLCLGPDIAKEMAGDSSIERTNFTQAKRRLDATSRILLELFFSSDEPVDGMVRTTHRSVDSNSRSGLGQEVGISSNQKPFIHHKEESHQPQISSSTSFFSLSSLRRS